MEMSRLQISSEIGSCTNDFLITFTRSYTLLCYGNAKNFAMLLTNSILCVNVVVQSGKIIRALNGRTQSHKFHWPCRYFVHFMCLYSVSWYGVYFLICATKYKRKNQHSKTTSIFNWTRDQQGQRTEFPCQSHPTISDKSKNCTSAKFIKQLKSDHRVQAETFRKPLVLIPRAVPLPRVREHPHCNTWSYNRTSASCLGCGVTWAAGLW